MHQIAQERLDEARSCLDYLIETDPTFSQDAQTRRDSFQTQATQIMAEAYRNGIDYNLELARQNAQKQEVVQAKIYLKNAYSCARQSREDISPQVKEIKRILGQNRPRIRIPLIRHLR